MALSEKAKAARREYMRRYREANKERINEHQRTWRQNNPEKVREYENKRFENLAKRYEREAK